MRYLHLSLDDRLEAQELITSNINNTIGNTSLPASFGTTTINSGHQTLPTAWLLPFAALGSHTHCTVRISVPQEATIWHLPADYHSSSLLHHFHLLSPHWPTSLHHHHLLTPHCPCLGSWVLNFLSTSWNKVYPWHDHLWFLDIGRGTGENLLVSSLLISDWKLMSLAPLLSFAWVLRWRTQPNDWMKGWLEKSTRRIIQLPVAATESTFRLVFSGAGLLARAEIFILICTCRDYLTRYGKVVMIIP